MVETVETADIIVAPVFPQQQEVAEQNTRLTIALFLQAAVAAVVDAICMAKRFLVQPVERRLAEKGAMAQQDLQMVKMQKGLVVAEEVLATAINPQQGQAVKVTKVPSCSAGVWLRRKGGAA